MDFTCVNESCAMAGQLSDYEDMCPHCDGDMVRVVSAVDASPRVKRPRSVSDLPLVLEGQLAFPF